MRELSMTPGAIKARKKRANKPPRICKSDGCEFELINPKQAQKYCSPLCRSKNYVWDSTHAICTMCGEDYKYQSHSYCQVCLVLRRHKITRDDLENILLSQFHRCSVCLKELDDDYQIDHDHSCCQGPHSCGNCIRGILHRGCNTALGNFNDDPEKLRRAAEYIERFTRI